MRPYASVDPSRLGIDQGRDTRRIDKRSGPLVEVAEFRHNEVPAALAAATEMLFELRSECAHERRHHHRMLDWQITSVRVRRHRRSLQHQIEIRRPSGPFNKAPQMFGRLIRAK